VVVGRDKAVPFPAKRQQRLAYADLRTVRWNGFSREFYSLFTIHYSFILFY